MIKEVGEPGGAGVSPAGLSPLTPPPPPHTLISQLLKMQARAGGSRALAGDDD